MEKTPGPASVYLMAGGRDSLRTDRDPLVARVLASCGVPHPSIAYVGAASGDSQPFFSMISRYFRRFGAGRITLAPLAGRRSKGKEARAILESADMVFISGGDVEAGMEVLEKRQILPFLRKLFETGKPFFGSSAGSIMLGRQWVRWEDPDDDATARLFPCMGFAPVVCDTHGEAEGWEELRALVRLAPEGTVGYGIPTGAGLCISPDGTLEALGAPVHCYSHGVSGVVRSADLPPKAL
ncbi:MAG TPA: Type 1 glutamine amidotransferase-like domain-containing protein [Thermodesulfobacteriota bacterium]|nr:Type 1 glutamine amidotransferase-like domain-containing protein [Thermodesulfobacteriota bacterium]